MCDVAAASAIYLAGVDEEYGSPRLHISHQSSSGIYIERGSDDDEYIGFLGLQGCRLYHWNALAEEDDERAEQRSVAGLAAWGNLRVVGTKLLNVFRVVGILTGTYLSQLAMQVYDL